MVAVSVILQFYILAMGNIVTKELLLSQVTRESFIEARIRGKSYCHQNERKSLHTLILMLAYIKRSQHQIPVSRDHSIWDELFRGSEDH